MLKIKNINQYLSLFLFTNYFVIIPIVLYQYYLGNIPYLYSILMNFNTVFSVLIIANIILFYKDKLNIYDISILFLMSYMGMVIIFDYFLYAGSKELFFNNSTILIRSFMLYIIGRVLIVQYDWYKSLLLFFFILLILEKLINLDSSYIRIFLDTEGSGVYLYLGDTFAVIAIFLISLLSNKVIKFLLVIVSLVILFVIGSRSSMFIFLVVLLFMMFKENNIKQNMFILISLISFANYTISYLDIDIENNRMFVLVSSDKVDISKQERSNMLSIGIEDIKNNPIIGNYGGQFYYEKNYGNYIHNILSFYRQYGLIVFIGLIIIFFYILRHYYFWMRNDYDNSLNYIFYISIFIIMELLLTRSYTTLHFWFAIGLFADPKKFIRRKLL